MMPGFHRWKCPVIWHFYQVGVLAKCLSVARFECSVPGWDLSLLGAGGPPGVAFEVVLPKSMLSTGSGEGCHFGLGDCLGTGV